MDGKEVLVPFPVIPYVDRFGCDGAEVIIPGMNSMVDKASELGIKSMSH